MAMRITYRRLVAGYRSRHLLVASAIGQVPAEVAEKSERCLLICAIEAVSIAGVSFRHCDLDSAPPILRRQTPQRLRTARRGRDVSGLTIRRAVFNVTPS